MVGGGRASSATFVGRRDELSRLEALLDGTRVGTAATAVVAGEAGIGKTRIATELARRAAAVDASVLTGACIELGDDVLPYAPFVEMLDRLVRAEGVAHVLELAGPTGEELGRLAPALAVGGPVPEASRGSSSRLYLALTALVEGLARRRPVVLVVEDTHWADRATRDLLALLAHKLRGRVLLLATCRTDEVVGDDEHRRFTAELARAGAHRIDLEPLSRDEQARQISGILGLPPSAELVDRVYGRADGNPFFAEELLALGAGSALPAGVRDLLLARVEALPKTTRSVLRVAAASGRRVPHRLLAAVADLPERELDEALRPAVTGHVLTADAAAQTYEFRHALLHEAVASTLLPGESARLHRRLAEALTAEPALAGDTGHGIAARVARHWLAARDDERTFEASYRAAREAAEGLAFDEALGHYDRAIGLLDVVDGADELLPVPRYQLLWDAAEAAHLSAAPGRAAELIRAAIDTVDDRHPYHPAYLHERLGRYLWMAADGKNAMAAYRRSVDLLPSDEPTCWRAAILGGYAQILMLAGRAEESRRHCEDALRITEQIPDGRAAQGHVRNTLGVNLATLGDLDAGIAHLLEARAIAEEEFDDVDDIGRAIVNLTSVLLDAGRFTDAARNAVDGLEVIDRLGLARRKGVWSRCDAAEALTSLGRWDEAQAVLDDAAALSPDGIDAIRLVERRGCLELRRGLLDDARAHLFEAREQGRRIIDGQTNGPLYTALAELAADQHRPAEALALAEEGAGRLLDDEDAAFCVPVFAAAARAAADLGVDAGPWVARAEAAVDRDAARKAPAVAFLHTARAEAARGAGGPAVAAWREAAAAWEALDDPWRTAYCRWREAEAALAEGLPREAATRAARSAGQIASQLGARTLCEAVDSLAGRARLRLTEPVPASDDEGAPFRLTRRERNVLELVAEGRTDRQIGEALFISHRTVERHVSNILAKVGASNRAEVAAVAHRNGLVRTG